MQTVMAGNDTSFDDFKFTAVPVGLSIYFVRHIMVCQTTTEKHKQFIKTPITNEGDGNFPKIYLDAYRAFFTKC